MDKISIDGVLNLESDWNRIKIVTDKGQELLILRHDNGFEFGVRDQKMHRPFGSKQYHWYFGNSEGVTKSD